MDNNNEKVERTVIIQDNDEGAAVQKNKSIEKSSTKHKSFVSFITDTFLSITGPLDDDVFEEMEDASSDSGEESDKRPLDTISDGGDTPHLSEMDSNYTMKDIIAEGGQGRVNKALDKQFRRVVAIKTLHDSLKDKEDIRASFIDEAQITAQLEHPSIVPVYGLFSDDKNGLHLAMKLIRGRTLREYLDNVIKRYSKMTWRQVAHCERKYCRQRLDFFLKVCDAISYVHNKNVIHRDLKPENIMLGKYNETYIMDWGIAEKYGPDAPDKPARMTGTPRYIAPEILNRQPYDQRSDVYLLGIILFEMVFLARAYPQEDPKEAMNACRYGGETAPFVHAFGCKVESDLMSIVAKATEFDPNDRYQSALELANDIRNFLCDEDVSSSPHPYLSRMLHFFRRHSQFLLWCIFVLSGILLLGAAGALSRELTKQIEEQKTDDALTDIYSGGILSGAIFDRELMTLEKRLSVLAKEAVVRLENPSKTAGQLHFYDYKAGRKPETAPPGYVFSPGYNMSVSFDTFVYKTSPPDVPEDLQNILTSISPLKKGFMDIIQNSFVEKKTAFIQPITEADKLFDLPPVSAVFIGFANGLEISFPYQTDYTDSFDPRQRPWYKAAVNAPDGVASWSEPYLHKGTEPTLMITCSVPLKNSEGKLLGVIGADMMPATLVNMVSHSGSLGSFITNRYLISGDGKIYADSSAGNNLHKENGKAALSSFEDMMLFKKMWTLKNGRVFANPDRSIVYFFQYIKSLNWLYVEKIDFENLKEMY